ncbi:alpha/beta fold hydrolase [Streptomyces sp. NPDC053048]|uniref:alpha/beta hydrolase n=1 Tax=Streptomyces sp. NPDC053048 TaxID=3365694 RepID=UPI0037D424D5
MAPAHVDLVFVHGLFSSAKVWKTFERLISTDPELSGWVSVHCFQYPSPVFRLRLDRGITEIDDIADQLGTYLETELAEATSIVLVTHSQGGLIVQRFLARKLSNGEGRDLARIRRFTMFSCPNTGSGFFLTARKSLKFWRHPQERQLRPFDRAVTESQRIVLGGVVHAHNFSDKECPIHIEAYGGNSDNVVHPVVARGVFPSGGVVDGDHFSIVQPADHSANAYIKVRDALKSAAHPRAATRADTNPDHAPPPGQQQGGHTVSPPFAKLEGTLKGNERISLVASVLSRASPRKVHVLAGLGGTGKSRLALEIANRARQADRKVWWVSVSQLNSCMRTIATELGVPEGQMTRAWMGEGSAPDLVWRMLNASRRPWLLVLDNADDPKQLGPRDGQVSDGTGWLREPATDHGLVVVTSRVRNQDTWGLWSKVHHVSPLGEDDGASMLLERTGGVGGTNEQARLLSAELGGLPLALRAAADFVKAVSGNKVSLLDGCVTDFDSYRKALKRRFESPPGTRARGLDELLGREIVEKVYGIALDLLVRQGLPQAAPALKVLACLNIAPIPFRCLVNGPALRESPLFPDASSAQCEAVLQGLVDLVLVDAHEREDVADPVLSHVLTLHPVVHGILRDDEDVRHRRTDYYGLAVRMLLNATKDKDPDIPTNWPLWTAIAPHAREVSRACLLGTVPLADRSVVVAALELTRLTARFLIAGGLLGPAQDLSLPVVANCASFRFHENDRELLALRHEKGRIALERQDLEAAEEELRQVVAARTRILGEDDADTLASRHKLARAIHEQGQWEEAERMLRPIVAAENKVRGPDHSDTLVVRHTLARAMLNLGRPEEAEAEAREILEIMLRDNWPPPHSEMLFVRETLARSLLAQKRAEEADAEITGALRDSAQPPESPLMMRLRYTLAKVLLGLGHAPEGLRELEDLLADRLRVSPSSPLLKDVETWAQDTRRYMSDPNQWPPAKN